MSKDILELLEMWYYEFCQNNSKNSNIITIHTVDNPGLYLKVNLNETIYKNLTFQEIEIDHGDDDWYFCQIIGGFFKGVGSPNYLNKILEIFLDEIRKYDEKNFGKFGFFNVKNDFSNNICFWLSKWYLSQCNGDWEHSYGIKITSTEGINWKVIIDLEDSDYMDMTLDKVSIKNNENDWFICQIKNYKFEGIGSYNQLTSILNTFRNSVEKFNQSSNHL